MKQPQVTSDRLVFTLDDAEHALVRVQLDCDDAVAGGRRFRRTRSGWSLTLPRPALNRLEYRLVVTRRGGESSVICDPGNPERVETAFGERSVVALPGYTPPAWLHDDCEPGAGRELVHEGEALGPLPLLLWSPAGLADDREAPLLVVHDGPEYATLAALPRYAAAMTRRNAVAPFRMALMQPVARDEWYAANDDYVNAELGALDLVAATVAVTGPLVLMGASLGGLAALRVARTAGVRAGGVFTQSGSFFDEALDDQESAYPFFDKVTAAVRDLAPTAATEALTIGMTCGRLEENWQNNLAMADRLTELGHRVELTPLDDLHNYTAWRDGLDPALTMVLQTVWGEPRMAP